MHQVESDRIQIILAERNYLLCSVQSQHQYILRIRRSLTLLVPHYFPVKLIEDLMEDLIWLANWLVEINKHTHIYNLEYHLLFNKIVVSTGYLEMYPVKLTMCWVEKSRDVMVTKYLFCINSISQQIRYYLQNVISVLKFVENILPTGRIIQIEK